MVTTRAEMDEENQDDGDAAQTVERGQPEVSVDGRRLRGREIGSTFGSTFGSTIGSTIGRRFGHDARIGEIIVTRA
ncbi:MAG: hypothetical protein JWM82_27 [Myxococcales bacterium]|nr:hypothetical protein [Myxococcales bacterium]